MDWNTFNKELQNRVSDGGVRYILGIIYERLLDVSKQNDQNAEVLLAMTEVVNNVVGYNEIIDARVQDLRKAIRGVSEGVELESVPLTNDDV